jgi:hypothetical protein
MRSGKSDSYKKENSTKRRCKSLFVTKLSSSFEPYKPDKTIMVYLNQHTRQLGLDPPSFANPKDKNNSSDKSERRKSSSSEKRKHRTDRFDRKRKRTDASDPKSKSDYKSRSRETRKEKFLLAMRRIVADPLANKGAHTLRTSIASVVTKMTTSRHHTNTQIWAKHPTKTRITNSKATIRRKPAYQLQLLRTMFVSVTHVVTLTT